MCLQFFGSATACEKSSIKPFVASIYSSSFPKPVAYITHIQPLRDIPLGRLHAASTGATTELILPFPTYAIVLHKTCKHFNV